MPELDSASLLVEARYSLIPINAETALRAGLLRVLTVTVSSV